MDSFTQMALGATIGEAGWRKSLGGRAPIWGAFCGLLPDLDVIATAFDPWADMVFHRSWTHSLFVLPLAALPIGWLGHRFGKRRGTVWQWIHLSLWALITHPALDVCTAFGTQLLAPVTNHRFALDAVSIVDLFYSVPLVLVCLLALRRGPPPRWRRLVSWSVLALTTGYLLMGYASMREARSAALAELRAEGFEPEAIRALPTFFNNQAFRILARRGEGDFRLGYWSNVAGRGTEWLPLRSARGEPVDALRATEGGRTFRWFTDDWVLVEAEPAGTYALIDLRFGGISAPVIRLFAVEARLTEGGWQVEPLPRQAPGIGDEPKALWELIRTGTSEVWQPAAAPPDQR